MRPQGKLRLGFFPLPVVEAERLRTYLSFSPEFSALDPCVGDGVAFLHLLQGTQARRYGIEIDANRAAQAVSLGVDTMHANTLDVRCPAEALSLLYLNPPSRSTCCLRRFQGLSRSLECTLHSSGMDAKVRAPIQRRSPARPGQKTVPKVFVTCELTIHGLGSNSSTGEAWADDDNSGTTAEAQAFKRAASCFGLGRYLYEVEKVWVDLDNRKHPVAVSLPVWATPKGWSKGLRPEFGRRKESEVPKKHTHCGNPKQDKTKREPSRQDASRRNSPSEIVAKIEQMHKSLGSPLYRGILKRVAKIWNPADIVDPKIEKQVLEAMEEAERLRQRFEPVLQRVGEEDFQQSLRSLQLRSFHQIDSVDLLARLVREMESRMSEPF